MNITFLNPLFLWFLPAIIAPVVIHLLMKRKPRRILFSHTGILQAVIGRTLPRTRLLEILLMLLRCIIILLLILIFSRPLMHKTASSGKDTQGNSLIAIILDNSYSMGAALSGRSNLERAKEACRTVIDTLRPGDMIALIVTSDNISRTIPPTSDIHEAADAVKDTPLSYRGTELLPAFNLAYRMLAASAAKNKTVILVSDMTQHGWKGLEEPMKDASADYSENVTHILIEVGSESGNTWIEDLEMNKRLSKDTVSFDITFAASKNIQGRDTGWDLSVNERGVSEGTVKIGADPVKQTIPVLVGERKSVQGYIELTKDALYLDDIRYFTLTLPEPIDLLVVDGDPSLSPVNGETYYLKPAIDTLKENIISSYRIVSYEELDDTELGNFDVLFLANCRLTPPLSERISSFLKKGGGVFITLGSKWSVETPGADFLPAEIEDLRDMDSYITFADIQDKHPVQNALTGEVNFELDKVHIKKAYRLTPHIESKTLIVNSQDGSPMLVSSTYGKGRIILWNTTIDRDWNNLPAKPFYISMLEETIKYLGNIPLKKDNIATIRVGEPYDLRSEYMPYTKARIICPGGKDEEIIISRGKTSYYGTNEPGIYKIIPETSPSISPEVFAVNLDVSEGESDLKRADGNHIRHLFRDTYVNWLKYPPDIRTELNDIINGKDISRSMAVLLLIFFVMEIFIATKFK